MATLHRFQDLSLPPHKHHYTPHFSPGGLNLQFALWRNHRFPPRELTLSASSSSSSSASNNSRVKTRKPVKSNADLCTELREFVSIAGLPEGHVPSFKELLHHGRKDLAYVVRRRGYRLIAEILSNSTEGDTNAEMNSAEYQNVTDTLVNESVGQGQQPSELVENSVLSDDDFKKNDTFSSENGVSFSMSSTKTYGCIESGTSLSLLEKASKFVKDGELDTFEEDGLSEPTENEKASVVSKSIPTSKLVLPHETNSDEILAVEEVDLVSSTKDFDVESSMGENKDEIDHLKAMLNQKEMELYQLKEQVEKEKLALSTLQAKAEKEISKVQEIMSSKDEELHNTEESLSGLKEVQIEYWGHGETVEVAGSFNGWHHRIKMDSPPLSTSVGPNELRKSRLWSTVLWLYPGIYEIKFVVDGHWLIDSRRESVTRGAIQNNILRVDS